MSLRQLCKQTTKRVSKALFFFPKEGKTGIAPTRLIVEKNVDFTVGQSVHVNWEGKKAQAEIIALNGKFLLIQFLISYCLQFEAVSPGSRFAWTLSNGSIKITVCHTVIDSRKIIH